MTTPRRNRTRKARKRERRAARRHNMTLLQWRAHLDELRREGRRRQRHEAGEDDPS